VKIFKWIMAQKHTSMGASLQGGNKDEGNNARMDKRWKSIARKRFELNILSGVTV
jgi:hypothetical protein